MTTKTNALRLLETADIAFTAREYDVSDGAISGVAVAAKIGREPERVFKTLVTEGKNTGLNVFVIPSNVELDLKKAAQAAGDKHIEMIKSRELKPKTGYVHGGCSPIGMKKQFPTFIDETAQLYDAINVSGGRVGLQVELAPEDLAGLVSAAFCDLF
ncbi:MAG: Cys-tRNA(Pro) deacylase [Clostridiales Family XIII bacterium]|jgi:Cys-tRNA(Pro)/Cys-tRNA(Cys) deacylase|nr:Cys-tRNA(Pro) deacylase [Clostridiales Family XIII bacterium]